MISEKTMLVLKCRIKAEDCIQEALHILERCKHKNAFYLKEMGLSMEFLSALEQSIKQEKLNIEKYDKWLEEFGVFK